MQTIEVTGGGDCRLTVDVSGDPGGQAVVFLHGISSHRSVWARQAPLASRLQLVSVDLRGHGDSDRPADGYGDPGLWAADLAAVLRELSLDRPVLVGWSYGGVVIADYIAEFGADQIGAVNLVGATTMLGAPVVPYLGDRFAALTRELLSTDAQRSVEALDCLIGLCTEAGLDPQDRLRMLGWNCLVPPYVRAGLLRRTVCHDDLLRGLTLPVLISHGERDQIFASSLATQHAHLMPTAKVSRYPAVGHMPFWESPARFNAELEHLAAEV